MKILCSCGHGRHSIEFYEPGHPNHGEIICHEVEKDGCCRKIVPSHLIPTNFRKEQLFVNWPKEGYECCDANGVTITVYTLTQQRGYSNRNGTWTMPKSEDSIDSLSSIANY